MKYCTSWCSIGKLDFSNKDLSVLFYPEDFVSSLNFQFIHYLNRDCNLSIGCYSADLNDFLRHGISNPIKR